MWILNQTDVCLNSVSTGYSCVALGKSLCFLICKMGMKSAFLIGSHQMMWFMWLCQLGEDVWLVFIALFPSAVCSCGSQVLTFTWPHCLQKGGDFRMPESEECQIGTRSKRFSIIVFEISVLKILLSLFKNMYFYLFFTCSNTLGNPLAPHHPAT
jgi:hypothetical protein